MTAVARIWRDEFNIDKELLKFIKQRDPTSLFTFVCMKDMYILN